MPGSAGICFCTEIRFQRGFIFRFNSLPIIRRLVKWSLSLSLPGGRGLQEFNTGSVLITSSGQEPDFFFEKGSRLNGTVNVKGNNDPNPEASSGDSTKLAPVVVTNWPGIARFPDRLHLGFELTTRAQNTFSSGNLYPD